MAQLSLDSLLRTPEGLAELLRRRVSEADPVDFKLEVNLRAPKSKPELRKDCATLSTAGVGYLVVGVRQTDDGLNQPRDIPGISDESVAPLKQAIEDTLGFGIYPPLSTGQREVWAVKVGENRNVLVVLVRGRLGYPVSVEDGNGADTHWVREAGKCRQLTAHEAAVRRRDLDLRPWRVLRPAVVVLGALLAGTLLVLWMTWDSFGLFELASNAERQAYEADQGRMRAQMIKQSAALTSRSSEVAQLTGQVAVESSARKSLESQLLEMRVAAAPRRLGDEKKKTLQELLSRCPTGVVEVRCPSDDGESCALAVDLIESINKSGWSVPVGLMKVIYNGLPPVGILVQVSSREDSEAVNRAACLLEALLKVSIEGVPALRSDIPRGTVSITVGTKPQK